MMKSKARLTWVPTEARIAVDSPLWRLTRKPARSRAARATAVDDAAVGGAAADDVAIDWPAFATEPTPLARLALLLRTAAEVEHALLVQYLYAGYSLPGDNPDRRVLLGVAVEEMSHLMTVQNLLFSIGEPPHLARQDFGSRDPAHRLFPFDLKLEPLSKGSLAKYIVAESPHQPWPDVDPQLAAAITAEAIGTAGMPVNRVGLLYGLLGVFFGTEAILAEKATTGDAWYVLVNSLAEQAAAHYGGRDQVHLPPDFQIIRDPRQGTKSTWDRSIPGAHDEFRIFEIDTRLRALEALRDIGLQGEGPSTAPQEDSHFRRFVRIFHQAFGSTGTGTTPIPTLAVPAAAHIEVNEAATGSHAISQAHAVRWAALADLRYALMLGFLEQFLLAPPDDREFLAAWCFVEMFHLKKLSQFLTAMPRSHSPTDMAAIPFNEPTEFPSDSAPPPAADGPSGWSPIHGDRLDRAIELATEILDPANAPVPPLAADRMQILQNMLEGDRRKLREVRARESGGTTRTRFDQVRETLDWAAGTGSPRHSNQGRFWERPLEAFRTTRVFGQLVTEPPTGQPGALPPLVEVLKTQDMPRDRPPLAADDPRIAFIERWITDGCPDDPL